MMVHRTVFLAFLALFFHTALSNDSTFDSLYQASKQHMDDSVELSIRLVKQAETIAFDNKDRDQLGKAYWQHGRILDISSKPDEAVRYYFGAIKAFKELGNDLYVAKLYENIGTIQLHYHLPNFATVSYETALKHCPDDSHFLKARLHLDMALAQRNLGKIDDAVRSLYEARFTCRFDAKDRDLLAKIHSEFGYTYSIIARETGETFWYDSAISAYKESINLAETDNPRLRALNNLGWLYLNTDRKEAGVACFEQILQAPDLYDGLLISTYNNLGIAHYQLGNYLLADSLIRMSIKINTREKDPGAVRQSLNNTVILESTDELIASQSYLDSLNTLTDTDMREVERYAMRTLIKKREIEMACTQELMKISQQEFEAQEAQKEWEAWIISLSLKLLAGLALLGVVLLGFYLLRIRKKTSAEKSENGELINKWFKS